MYKILKDLNCLQLNCHSIQALCLAQLYSLLGDKDNRVRSAAATALCQHIRTHSQNNKTEPSATVAVYEAFVKARILKELPPPLCHINVAGSETPAKQFVNILSAIINSLSNKLLEVNDKNQQVIICFILIRLALICLFSKLGTINALVELIYEFSPVNYHFVWAEFKVYAICSSMLNHGADLTMQSNLICICTHLLAGNFKLN